ncbi:MAG: peroxiredoxin [Rhodopseudomonas palustris]|nr:peroxiredoxin [Rhodopseudomonas palustris]
MTSRSARSRPCPTTGQPAPDFTLPARWRRHRLACPRCGPARPWLYFYPKDDTPGCTLEAQEFTALRCRISPTAGTTVIGISKDSVKSHDRFCAKHGLGDHPGLGRRHAPRPRITACGRRRACMARPTWSIERSTFLIDGEGRIARVWRKVTVARPCRRSAGGGAGPVTTRGRSGEPSRRAAFGDRLNVAEPSLRHRRVLAHILPVSAHQHHPDSGQIRLHALTGRWLIEVSRGKQEVRSARTLALAQDGHSVTAQQRIGTERC